MALAWPRPTPCASMGAMSVLSSQMCSFPPFLLHARGDSQFQTVLVFESPDVFISSASVRSVLRLGSESPGEGKGRRSSPS